MITRNILSPVWLGGEAPSPLSGNTMSYIIKRCIYSVERKPKTYVSNSKYEYLVTRCLLLLKMYTSSFQIWIRCYLNTWIWECRIIVRGVENLISAHWVKWANFFSFGKNILCVLYTRIYIFKCFLYEVGNLIYCYLLYVLPWVTHVVVFLFTNCVSHNFVKFEINLHHLLVLRTKLDCFSVSNNLLKLNLLSYKYYVIRYNHLFHVSE